MVHMVKSRTLHPLISYAAYVTYITICRKTSNIRHTLLGNKIVDHSDVVGACSNYIFIFDLIPDLNGLGKDNSKARQETFKVWDLVRLILDIWR